MGFSGLWFTNTVNIFQLLVTEAQFRPAWLALSAAVFSFSVMQNNILSLSLIWIIFGWCEFYEVCFTVWCRKHFRSSASNSNRAVSSCLVDWNKKNFGSKLLQHCFWLFFFFCGWTTCLNYSIFILFFSLSWLIAMTFSALFKDFARCNIAFFSVIPTV